MRYVVNYKAHNRTAGYLGEYLFETEAHSKSEARRVCRRIVKADYQRLPTPTVIKVLATHPLITDWRTA